MSPRFGFWTHVISQIVLLVVFIVYTFFMYYVDTGFIKQCRLKKLKVGKECRRVTLEYLKIICYPSLCIYALFALNHFDRAATTYGSMGLFSLLLVFVISACTDTFAYIVGNLFKGPKLCPKLSPKKTWAGAIGGVFGAVIGTLTLVLIIGLIDRTFVDFMTEKEIYRNIGIFIFILIGLVGSIVAQAGDIFASYIKRKHGIKDFGKILPGHGGVMDRVDGHIFCAVFIFACMSIICFIL